MREGQRAAMNPGSALVSAEGWTELRLALKLSAREFQIVQHVFNDEKQESIAIDLGISPHTVNTYIQRLHSKLNVFSRPQLIVRVIAEYLRLILNE